jgi:hypothetical protein
MQQLLFGKFGFQLSVENNVCASVEKKNKKKNEIRRIGVERVEI